MFGAFLGYLAKQDLILVTLNPEQIKQAKDVNGERKRITHALLCGSYGQMFGTYKQCNKYYSVWKNTFPNLFKRSIEVERFERFEIIDYESTNGLVMKLIAADEPHQKRILKVKLSKLGF